MRTRSIRQVVANAVAVVTVIGIVFGAVTGCGSPDQSQPPPAAPPAEPGTPGDMGAGAGGALGTAGSAAAAMAALGGLGESQGVAGNVRTLGAQYSTDGQELLDQLKAGAGGNLESEPTPEQQASLADLRARSGDQFDAAWLRTAGQFQQQARDAANAVLADENASDEAKAAAQDALNRLDSLAEGLEAAAPSGATTPNAVDAGSGGQAAGDVTPAAIVLVGLGTLLLAGALWWRRRAA